MKRARFVSGLREDLAKIKAPQDWPAHEGLVLLCKEDKDGNLRIENLPAWAREPRMISAELFLLKLTNLGLGIGIFSCRHIPGQSIQTSKSRFFFSGPSSWKYANTPHILRLKPRDFMPFDPKDIKEGFFARRCTNILSTESAAAFLRVPPCCLRGDALGAAWHI
jgi:hypothetical protein